MTTHAAQAALLFDPPPTDVDRDLRALYARCRDACHCEITPQALAALARVVIILAPVAASDPPEPADLLLLATRAADPASNDDERFSLMRRIKAYQCAQALSDAAGAASSHFLDPSNPAPPFTTPSDAQDEFSPNPAYRRSHHK